MPDDGSFSITRRQFLGGCGAACAAVAAPATAATPPSPSLPTLDPESAVFGNGGRISPEGQRSIAEVDRRFQQERPQMGQTLRAVEDLGLDPTGQTSVNDTLASELNGLSNTRIVFPSDGVFLLSSQ